MGNDGDYRKQVGIDYHPMTLFCCCLLIVLSSLNVGQAHLLRSLIWVQTVYKMLSAED